MDEQLATEYYNAGLEYTKTGDLDKALESLNRAIAEDPKHVNSHNALGSVYRQKGELDLAKKWWRAALKIDPYNVTARQCLEAVREPAQIQVKALLWVAAVVVLVLAALIITNVVLLQRISKLESELELARATAPEIQDPGFKAEDETEQKDEQTQPAEPSEEAITQQPSETKPPVQATRSRPPATPLPIMDIYDQALADCRSGWYDQAMEGFQRVLEHPSSHDLKDNAQYWLAECYYAQKEYIKALDEFLKVKRDFSAGNKVFDAELKIAYTYHKLDSVDLARQKLSQLSRDWPHQQYTAQINILWDKIRTGSSD
ncbi:tetratricopeptide repeat protein [Candidatus Poribacteria bacterium]